MSKPNADKRASRRLKADGKLKVRGFNAHDGEAHLRDFSTRGVFLYLHHRVAEGALLDLVLPLPAGVNVADEGWIRCKCRVVRVEDRGNEFGVAAVIEEFEPLDASTLPQA
jgi:PilZ domain